MLLLLLIISYDVCNFCITISKIEYNLINKIKKGGKKRRKKKKEIYYIPEGETN